MQYKLRDSILPQKDSYSTIEKVFAARGIAPDQINHYLNTSSKDVPASTTLMNVENGAKMLMKHILAEDKIFIVVDSDCDGFTSAACLINYLNCLFPNYVQTKIFYILHQGKQHGLEDVYDKIYEDEYGLVICPDSSSNDYIQHTQLWLHGIDVLVLDHHEAEKISNYACIINNQLCDYPTKSLSGVGVVYKFCCYLDELMGTSYANNFLDLVAIGMTGDMMDIRDFETKYLISQGIQNVRNPFIKEMCKVQNYSIEKAGGLCPFAISFYIVPQVNGTIRMGDYEQKLLLFESMLDFKGYESLPSTKRGCKGQYETRAEQACRNCTNLKRAQQKAIDSSLGIITNRIEEENLLDNKIVAVQLMPGEVPRNLTGLIANQLMARYKHPFMILTEVEKEDGIYWDGSARGYETADFNDLKAFVKESNLSSLAEGHPNAFGSGFKDENFDKFIKYSNEQLKDFDFNPCTRVDFIFTQNSFDKEDILSIGQLRTIWGQNLEEPCIAIENINVTQNNLSVMGKGEKKTIKIKLPNGVDLIKFGLTEDEIEELTPNSYESTRINILGTCKINEWNGNITPQVEIKEYEIVEKNYFF